ncbi:MAG: hypothetical protein OEM04_00980 [Flavobacteriaceae bacterium]|nr:hypothetical protein [Flavobacteriaceae bacterium]
MKITGKTFATKKEEIDYLVKHNKEIIEFKKAVVKHTTPTTTEAEISSTLKALSTSKEHDTDNVIKRTVIGNTYNWLDSHGDVHLDGTFGKSISERQNKIWHLHDHEQKITAKVGIPSKIYEEKVSWSDLGIKKAGTTTALMMDSDIRKDYNNLIFQEYKDGNIDQHSVGMYYVKIDFAVNDKEHKAEFKTWNDNIENIGNREKAEELGYFYAVKEAKLVEISAVLQGSNELTPTIEAKDIEPSKDTQNEPEQSTHKINNNLRNNFLI